MRFLLPLLLFVTTLVPEAPAPPDRTWPQFRGPSGRGDLARSTRCRRNGRRPSTSAWKADVPGRGVVVADRLGRPGDRDHRDQRRRLQAAIAGHLRQRLRRRAAGGRGCQRRRRSWRSSARAISSRRQESGDLQFMIYSFDVATRQAALGAAGAQGPAGRRPPSQEHLRVGDAGDRRRARLRAVRQHRRCSATRWTASCCGRTRSIRSRATSISARPPRRSCTTAASTSSTTTRKARTSPRSTRRPAPSIWKTPRKLERAGCVGLVDALRLGQRAAHRDRRHRHRRRDQLRHWTARSCGASRASTQANPTPTEGEGMLYVGTGSQGESNRPLFAIKPGAAATSR